MLNFISRFNRRRRPSILSSLMKLPYNGHKTNRNSHVAAASICGKSQGRKLTSHSSIWYFSVIRSSDGFLFSSNSTLSSIESIHFPMLSHFSRHSCMACFCSLSESSELLILRRMHGNFQQINNTDVDMSCKISSVGCYCCVNFDLDVSA